MFLGLAAIGRGHCVEKERARGKIDNGRAGDAHEIKLSAYEIVSRHRRANVALPNDAASGSVERINIVGFGHGNDHCPAARAVLDVKRLGVNVASNSAIETQVTRQTGGSALRENRIDIKTVARIMVVVLRHVDRPICRNNAIQGSNVQASNNEPESGIRMFHEIVTRLRRFAFCGRTFEPRAELFLPQCGALLSRRGSG